MYRGVYGLGIGVYVVCVFVEFNLEFINEYNEDLNLEYGNRLF